ncbi:MAG: lysostaphin resistance A-like protein [Terriglobales bacterium]
MQGIVAPGATTRRRLTRPVPRERQYSLLGLLGLFALVYVLAGLLYLAHPSILTWGLWSNPPELAAALAVAFALRPEYLAASRWRAPAPVLAAGVAAAYLLQSAFIRWDPVAKRHVHVTWPLFLAAVIVTPILEELFFRALLLRGVIYRIGLIWGVVVLDAAWAWAHPTRWDSASVGLVLCAVYLWAEDSVGASAVCHASMNVVILFPQWSLFLLLRK